MNTTDEVREEAGRRYVVMSEWDESQEWRQEAFIAGAEWQASRPITDAQMVEKVARAIFAEEQCDRRQKRTAESLEENWLTRLDDRDQEEYRALARAAVTAVLGVRS